MRKIDLPQINVETIIDKCLNTIICPYKRSLLSKIKKQLIGNEKVYITLGERGVLHNICEHLSNDEAQVLKWIYENKLANKKGACRKYYDNIILYNGDVCPYCEINLVSTLDHFLAKSLYPSYSITPINLVPACRDCNHNKTTYKFAAQSDLLVNPYFEESNQFRWLYAEVNFTAKIVSYYSKPDIRFGEVMIHKINSTFNLFKLDKLYSYNANLCLSSLHFLLSNIYNAMGSSGVKRYLRNLFISNNQISTNYWKTVLYEALYNSDKYCDGRFQIFGGNLLKR